jgi:acetaldehyde dehydrogenase/alcohol dehydrogenase
MQFHFHKNVPKVTLGNGAILKLKDYTYRRVALIVDRYLLETEVYKVLNTGIYGKENCRLICDVAEEPSYEMVDKYIPVVRDYKPDCFVVVGGGSAMDTAKALWMFYELPDISWESAVSGPLPAFPGKAVLIAVPTTSGTGSEVSGAGVYKHYNNTKAMIISDELRPTEAILDYSLLKTIPSKVIAHSGADALAHALGALSCKAASEIDKLISEAVSVRIIKNLVRSYQGDADARVVMHVSSYLAGDMMNNAGGGLEHKLDRFAKAYHLPHGLVIGIFLPYTMLYLLPENHYAEIAEELGFSGGDRQKKLVEKIWEIYDAIGIPRTLRETGVPENEFLSGIPEYIRQVKEIGHIYWIRGFRGDGDLEGLYKQAYYGI